MLDGDGTILSTLTRIGEITDSNSSGSESVSITLQGLLYHGVAYVSVRAISAGIEEGDLTMLSSFFVTHLSTEQYMPDVITYTITDTDGDLDTATLTLEYKYSGEIPT